MLMIAISGGGGVLMRAAMLMAMGLSIVGLSLAGEAPAMQRKPVNIPAQDLQFALQALGQQKGLRIIFTSEDVANLQAHSVTGDLTPDEALRQLLGGTGLTYQHLDPQTVSILPSDSGTPLPETPATGQLTSAAQAQATPKAQLGDSAGGAIRMAQVTVTSPREDDAQRLEGEIRQFVQSHANTGTHDDVIPRWHKGVCPQTTGLSAPRNEFISGHVKEIAAQVGAPSGSRWKCPQPNVEIVFTSEPETAWADAVKVSTPASQSVSQAGETLGFSHPIQAFYVTVDRAYRSARERYMRPGGWVARGPLAPPVHDPFVRVVIVVDTNRVLGYKAPAIADYIALLALSTETSLDQCGDLPSILDLLSSGCEAKEKPQSLSASDTAYLKALYSVSEPGSVTEEKDSITERMMPDIERAESDSGANRNAPN
jgi:hypothetical protein